MINDKKGLFTGTSEYYSRYRVSYPKPLINLIKTEFNLNGQGRLLDLGCGTGQLIIPLNKFFEESVGIDINAEMLEEAKRILIEDKNNNVKLLEMSAENISSNLGKFDLIVCGNSLHWMDREKVLELCFEMLNPSGGVVILAGGSGSIWTGKEIWQQEVVKVIKRWLGNERKAGTGTFPNKMKMHQDYIKESRFKTYIRGDYHFKYSWSFESILGNLYSTSFSNKKLLGDNATGFEEDLKNTLYKLNSDGAFLEEIEITYFFMHKNKNPNNS